VAQVVSSLTALEKMDLFAFGITPERLDSDAQKLLKANIDEIYRESDAYPIYEGRIGASPREMRTVLLDAGQSKIYKCLSPLSVLTELDELCERVSEYEWLQEEQLAGGYHDHKAFREAVRARLLDNWEVEMRVASGLVSESQYGELFDKYITHVGVWVKKEKVRNRLTGKYEEPDELMMGEVEGLLGVKGDTSDFRRGLISAIAAWAIDHPDAKIDNTVVFAGQTKKIRDAVFGERRKQIALLARDMMLVLSEQPAGLSADQIAEARAATERLKTTYGYCEDCARDTVSSLVRWRYAELVN
jgi:predicted Ser/Thr protein kinase